MELSAKPARRIMCDQRPTFLFLFMIKNKKPAVAIRYRIRVNLKKTMSILYLSKGLFNNILYGEVFPQDRF